MGLSFLIYKMDIFYFSELQDVSEIINGKFLAQYLVCKVCPSVTVVVYIGIYKWKKEWICFVWLKE